MNSDQRSQLEDLLKRIVDSHEGYKAYAKKSEQDRHKKLFEDFAKKRSEYITSVSALLETDGQQVDIDTSFIADARGAYTDFINKFNDGDDEALLSELNRLENTLASEYKTTIKQMTDQPEVLKTIQHQCSEVKNAAELMDVKQKAA